VVVAAALALLVPAPPAVAVTCGNLQTALNATSPGDIVQVDEGSTCTGAFTLPSHTITLQGGGSGATFDGQDLVRSLEGNNVGTTAIQNLTFRNGRGNNSGGALRITGASTPTLDSLHFFGNATQGASTDHGGGAFIGSTSSSGTIVVRDSTFGDGTFDGRNLSDFGGALAISTGCCAQDVEVTGSTFQSNEAQLSGGGLHVSSIGLVTLEDNNFVLNASFGAGGGAHLALLSGNATLNRNGFNGNTVINELDTPDSALGGGLLVESFSTGTRSLSQTDNAFVANRILDISTGANFSPRGAGEYVAELDLTSRGDEFIANQMSPAKGTGEAEGAGLWFGQFCDPVDATLSNVAIAANTVGGSAHGAGMHVSMGPPFDCDPGTGLPIDLTLRNSTIVNNGATGGTAGLWGSSADTLTMTNSILAANNGGLDLVISGFATRNITYSDVCFSTGGFPHPGAGNICANPALQSSSGDVHQTAASPTLDAGSNAAVPGPVATDYEGDPRIQDSDGDGSAVVDMGADEYPPPSPPTVEGGDTVPPDTTITKGPKDKTKKKTATFTFTGTDARVVASFQCKVDSAAFAPCTSPHTVNVKKGNHTFQVQAIDQAGNVGPPATDDWKVKKKKKKKK
jgi:hypothetical protein